MLLILTHENADFDAVASQLAAYKLYPEGTPLLSWRVNRNVSQFLTLYWDALPFRRPENWRRQRVERVMLVDTSALSSIRGVRQDKVQVQVVDHHALPEDRDESWTFHVEPVGATTTILVEMLQAAGLSLSVTEATLLLLGVHEDTGSLLYDTSTVRDARAAVWLMNQGARLPIVRRFLNIPLSNQQRALYERLLEAVEWQNIEGQTIAISAVEAPPAFEDEISAVAHRLRDALSPDGLFLLVALKHEHVQLVARSSNDNVDVAVVAHELGGGGHSRAAAATVMEGDLAHVRDRLRQVLPAAVKPMAKVGQIMSYGVQTVTADTTVGLAAEQMQRFGHEGYPVIDPASRELIGLLTRRAVDRAISHKLENLPVSQIMRAGQVTVRPSDSVEQVQRRMIEEGWGQIPVVSELSESGEGVADLIGIVTRTDVINLQTGRAQPEDDLDMRQVMARSLPRAVWDMVQEVGTVAAELEMPLYFVGGLVRDLLLDKPPVDIDMVVEGDAIALARRLKARYGGNVHSHKQFGTAKWLLSSQAWWAVAPEANAAEVPDTVDFVTARTEFYTQPSALPEVERGSIKLDLHRRDFSINTLAVRLDGAHLGELLDFYGGRRDLEQKLIRVLHSLSFVDDPTRILRAIRLEQRLGFRIEERTAELMAAALPMLERVTGDRIRRELEFALEENHPLPLMERLAELGVMTRIHPALTWDETRVEAFRRVPELVSDPLWQEALDDALPTFVYFALWIVPLPSRFQKAVMTRLRVRKSTRVDVLELGRLLQDLSDLEADAPPSRAARTLRAHRPRVLLVALAAVGRNSPAGRQIETFQREWRHVDTDLDGNDLIALGLKPGPLMGELLERLLAARLDGEVSDEAGEQALLETWLAAVE